MDRFRAWGLTAALAAGTAGTVAADPPAGMPAPGTPTTLYAKWFGQPAAKKAAAAAAARTPNPAEPPGALAPDAVADALRAEQDAWERRMSVCLKLRDVAIAKNNDALLKQVDDLERQATALYNARVAALGVPKVKSPLPEPSAAAVALDRQLGTGAAVTPLTAPAAPTPLDPAVRTAEARTPNDVIREVRP